VSPEGEDVRLFVVVEFHGFREASETWVAGDAWSEFVRGFRQVEASRRGRVQIRSMSPGEMLLDVGLRDALGHFTIKGMLGVIGTRRARLEFGEIELDPTTTPRIVEALQTSLY